MRSSTRYESRPRPNLDSIAGEAATLQRELAELAQLQAVALCFWFQIPLCHAWLLYHRFTRYACRLRWTRLARRRAGSSASLKASSLRTSAVAACGEPVEPPPVASSEIELPGALTSLHCTRASPPALDTFGLSCLVGTAFKKQKEDRTAKREFATTLRTKTAPPGSPKDPASSSLGG